MSHKYKWNRHITAWKNAMKPPSDTVAAFVYVFSLGYDSLYKIGMTHNVEARLKALRAGNPNMNCVYSVMVTDARKVEGLLHKRYRKAKIEREVFKLPTLKIEIFEKVAAPYKFKEYGADSSPKADTHDLWAMETGTRKR